MLESTILFILFFIIIMILVKKGVLSISQQRGFVYKKGNRKVSLSYQYFNGIQDSTFRFTPGQKVTIHYHITVEQGQFILLIGRTFSKQENAIFEEKYNLNSEGEITFIPNEHSYVIRMEGIKTKGGCQIEVH
ncbi:hypothetical protein [Ornithinibacillus xuwenensis]|uniref:Uncharacterized protein n=1 Tax=Ornithinibacillus xuwenensis TaxID=3144668 RepID=A0ABU9XG22_9BACI